MQHFPITTSFLKREGDLYTSIMQDIMRAYLLFKSAPLLVSQQIAATYKLATYTLKEM